MNINRRQEDLLMIFFVRHTYFMKITPRSFHVYLLSVQSVFSLLLFFIFWPLSFSCETTNWLGNRYSALERASLFHMSGHSSTTDAYYPTFLRPLQVKYPFHYIHSIAFQIHITINTTDEEKLLCDMFFPQIIQPKNNCCAKCSVYQETKKSKSILSGKTTFILTTTHSFNRFAYKRSKTFYFL